MTITWTPAMTDSKPKFVKLLRCSQSSVPSFNNHPHKWTNKLRRCHLTYVLNFLFIPTRWMSYGCFYLLLHSQDLSIQSQSLPSIHTFLLSKHQNAATVLWLLLPKSPSIHSSLSNTQSMHMLLPSILLQLHCLILRRNLLQIPTQFSMKFT